MQLFEIVTAGSAFAATVCGRPRDDTPDPVVPSPATWERSALPFFFGFYNFFFFSVFVRSTYVWFLRIEFATRRMTRSRRRAAVGTESATTTTRKRHGARARIHGAERRARNAVTCNRLRTVTVVGVKWNDYGAMISNCNEAEARRAGTGEATRRHWNRWDAMLRKGHQSSLRTRRPERKSRFVVRLRDRRGRLSYCRVGREHVLNTCLTRHVINYYCHHYNKFQLNGIHVRVLIEGGCRAVIGEHFVSDKIGFWTAYRILLCAWHTRSCV